jgi:pepF/M3 family oligoendopeptidase
MIEIKKEGKVEELPLPVIRNMYHDDNPDIRKKAYKAEIDAYSDIEQSAAACLNSIKGEIINISELKGYKSVLHKTLQQSRLKKKTLDLMFDTVGDYLPEFEKFFQKKAKILGYKKGLPFYDLFASIKGFDKKFDYDEAKNFIIDNFKDFSQDLADFAQYAFENNWIDAKPREGKRGGAFCSNIHAIGESRILANFNGEFSNVKTLAHELGHGYHGHILKEESILNSSYPMPLAETASIFCETIVMEAILNKSKKQEKKALLEKQLTNYGQIIVDIYSRYLFEDEVINRRKEEILSAEELKNIMIKAQKKAYGQGLDHKNLHPYMWLNKPHYYIPDLHYYNFPYTFGLLFAKGVYAVYKQKGDDFIPEYKKLLKATGKMEIEKVAGLVGIDINKKEFWKNSLELIKNEINEFLKL